MDVTIVIATFGGLEWERTAKTTALPSAQSQANVILAHGGTLAQARNAGAEAATSDWIMFLDADDQLADGYVEAMAQGAADVRAPAQQYARPGHRSTRPPQAPVISTLRDGNNIVIGCVHRRTYFERVEGFREWGMYEDWDYWQRIELAGATFESIPDALYLAQIRRNSRNRAPSHTERERWHHAIRKANYPELYP